MLAPGWTLASLRCAGDRSVWRFSRKVPGAAARKRLAQAPFRIPTDAWDRRAGAASDSNGPRRESSRPKDRTHPRKNRTTELELRDQVTRYREMLADPTVSTDARVKAERGLSAVLTALSRIEGTHISEAQIATCAVGRWINRAHQHAAGAKAGRCERDRSLARRAHDQGPIRSGGDPPSGPALRPPPHLPLDLQPRDL
jgi:hypothetical protein